MKQVKPGWLWQRKGGIPTSASFPLTFAFQSNLSAHWNLEVDVFASKLPNSVSTAFERGWNRNPWGNYFRVISFRKWHYMTPEVPSQQSSQCKALMNKCSLAALAHKWQNSKMKESDLNPPAIAKWRHIGTVKWPQSRVLLEHEVEGLKTLGCIDPSSNLPWLPTCSLISSEHFFPSIQ